MSDVLATVGRGLRAHFAATGLTAEPGIASITFLGTDRIEVLRFGPTPGGVYHYVSLGCSRHPMTDPGDLRADGVSGPRAEVVLTLRGPTPAGLTRAVAILAAAPAVEGLVLQADALVDLGESAWAGSAFTAMLLGDSDIDDIALDRPRSDVRVFSATGITATEAAWVRLKGAAAMREAWRADGVDVLDPGRRAASAR